MVRNAKYVMTKLIDPSNLAKPAQVGVDLTVAKLFKAIPEGVITLDEDSKIRNFHYEELPLDEEGYWNLEPNSSYQVQFDQGLKILDSCETARICARSSLNRVGVQVLGVVFDPGYGIEEGIGCALFTAENPVRIHVHDRIAQFQIFLSEEVDEDNLYKGRWQNTNQVETVLL